jgi:hypothetical protein
MISSAISVVQKTPDVLEIHVPASHFEAVGWVIIGIILLITGLASFRRKFQFVLFFVLGVYVVWMGVIDWSSGCRAILSAVDQTLTVRETSLFGTDTDSYPLNSVSQAVVESQRGNHRLFFAMNDGKEVFMSGFTMQNGYYQAQQAINSFLTHHISASQATPAPASNTPPGSTQ